MKRAFVFSVLGFVIFVVCYSLVYRIGAQFIRNVPSTEPMITKGVTIISLLMTLVALRQIYELFRSKRRNW